MSRQRRAVKNLNNPPNEAVRLNGSAGGAVAQHHHHPDDGPQVASRMSVTGSMLTYITPLRYFWSLAVAAPSRTCQPLSAAYSMLRFSSQSLQ